MAATAMLSSMVCSRIFSLTIKQCPHHKKETKKYTSIPPSSTFSQVFQTYHGPADPEFHFKVWWQWCSERGHEEGHEIDDTETALFNIVDLFPVKYITFSCLKRAVEEPHMARKELTPWPTSRRGLRQSFHCARTARMQDLRQSHKDHLGSSDEMRWANVKTHIQSTLTGQRIGVYVLGHE